MSVHRAALRTLPSLLVRTGYVDAYAAFGTLNLRRMDIDARRAVTAPPTQAMLDLWFLERTVSSARLGSVLAFHDIDALVDAGALSSTPDGFRSAIGVLLPLFGHVIAIPGALSAGSVHFGPDSIALAGRGAPRTRGRCADLCTGTGIQALRALGVASSVVAFDVDPVAIEWARRNAFINSVDDRIEFHNADLGAAIDAGRFDHVIASPPCAPVPPGLRCSPRHAGGGDGLSVMRRVLALLPEILVDRGSAQLVGTCLGTEAAPQIVEELRASGLQCVVTITSRVTLTPGERTFDRLVRAYALESERSVAEVEAELQAHLRTLGTSDLFWFVSTVTRAQACVEVTRYDRAGGVGFFA